MLPKYPVDFLSQGNIFMDNPEVCLLANSKSSQLEDEDRYQSGTSLKEKSSTVAPSRHIKPRDKGKTARNGISLAMRRKENDGYSLRMPHLHRARGGGAMSRLQSMSWSAPLVPSPFLTNCKNASVQDLP